MQAVAIKSILADRKLSISHSKGMNSDVDNLSHLDLLWGRIFVHLLHLTMAIYYFENSCFKPKHGSKQQDSKSRGSRKADFFLSLISTLLLKSLGF